MLETTVKYMDGVKFAVETRGHRFVCDQPRDHGGDDAGVTPPELMLASLATCAAYYVVQYLKVRLLPIEGLSVRVEAEKAQQPARLGSFRIVIEAPLVQGEQHINGMRRAAEKCLIHNTLLHTPVIEIEVVPSGCERETGDLVGQGTRRG